MLAGPGRGDRDAPGPRKLGTKSQPRRGPGPGLVRLRLRVTVPVRPVIAMAPAARRPAGGHAPTIIIRLEKIETSNPGPRRSGASGPGMWADRGEALKLW